MPFPNQEVVDMHEPVCQYDKCNTTLKDHFKAPFCALSTGTSNKLKVFGIKVLDREEKCLHVPLQTRLSKRTFWHFFFLDTETKTIMQILEKKAQFSLSQW